MNIKIREKHSRWIRWTHWIHFLVLMGMIWSGFLIYWANPAYPPFFPENFFKLIHADGNLAEGMALHFTLAWLFSVNGAIYFIFLFLSGAWRDFIPDREGIKNLVPVFLHEIGFRKKSLSQKGKFNPVQQLAYLSVTLMGMGSIISGLAIYKPVQLHRLAALLGGYEGARFVHFVLTLSFIAFFLVHIIQVTRAGFENFRSMVAGFEVAAEDKKND